MQNLNNNLKQFVEHKKNIIKEIKKYFADLINNMGNSDITYIDNSDCFIINKGNLDKNLTLSPFRYDYRRQLKLLERFVISAINNPSQNSLHKIDYILSNLNKPDVDTIIIRTSNGSYNYDAKILLNIKDILEEIRNYLIDALESTASYNFNNLTL
ncbi:hypothetical protein DEFDS_P137 (plasmid) [Deferribacter desulfuricans SSM1]|uniref:Uncharacterized protein n=1 Tax=Deferribacter desulfuricans (strain DSM 14783 / JCM 11476 / NBRC 101012 / SSM1) TaxID=639282 RepID=D3PEW7_DEFDS|nr:hypothetical protein [Deferribacter desulfuricans]BAI81759.1 hypothetical protein DEFDS_P137 [Deferribacter desulfuricans SSM1]